MRRATFALNTGIGAALAALGLAFVAQNAQAISRYNPLAMTCSQVKAKVRAEGAVIYRWPSRQDPSRALFGRYVANVGYCASGEVVETGFIPSADRKNCGVLECTRNPWYDDDFFRLWRRR